MNNTKSLFSKKLCSRRESEETDKQTNDPEILSKQFLPQKKKSTTMDKKLKSLRLCHLV